MAGLGWRSWGYFNVKDGGEQRGNDGHNGEDKVIAWLAWSWRSLYVGSELMTVKPLRRSFDNKYVHLDILLFEVKSAAPWNGGWHVAFGLSGEYPQWWLNYVAQHLDEYATVVACTVCGKAVFNRTVQAKGPGKVVFRLGQSVQV